GDARNINLFLATTSNNGKHTNYLQNSFHKLFVKSFIIQKYLSLSMTQIYCTNIIVSLRKYQIILILCRIGGDGVGTPAATAHPHNGTGRGIHYKIQASASIKRSATSKSMLIGKNRRLAKNR
ncbi:MAG: hypothetical protein IKA35_01715, partial [Bacteroidaceae bacterium]|nr:hypothetical protein [Bacteroidaceae bacterium]